MRRTMTLLFPLFLTILTVGLLVPNPFAFAGGGESWLRALYSDYLDPVAHFVLFSMLGLLAYGSRWPTRLPVRMGFIVVYALATEGLQYLVPPRTPELKDIFQNLAGGALGAAAGWLLLRRRQVSAADKPNAPEVASK